MKGLVSFALLLVFATVLARVSQTRTAAAAEAYSAKEAVFALEKRYYVDVDLKNAFRQVLAAAQGTGSEEKIVDAARKLALLEEFAEKKYAEKGIHIDCWVGEADAPGLRELYRKMLDEKRALKPPGAMDLYMHVLDWRGGPVPVSAGLLAVDPASGKLFVSRNSATVPAQPFQKPVFGASIYFDDVAAVAIIGEGFHA